MTLKEKLGLKSDPVFLMDGTAFIYRGFYASRHMSRSDGFPTNSLVIVSRILLRILRQENPAHFLFVMDGKGRNFRHDLYADYKANRESMPEDLVCQIEPVKRMARALGLAIEISVDCEADDCIASLAARFSGDVPVIIVSGDKDLKQCLGPSVFMWDPGAKEERVLTEELFTAENGVSPAQWPDVQALIGDSSDNIPGVPGIGPKTAREIFRICSSLEDIRDHFALLPPKVQARLKGHMDKIFLWRELATLRLDQCPGMRLADLSVRAMDLEGCRQIAREYELAAVSREISALHSAGQAAGQKKPKAGSGGIMEEGNLLEELPAHVSWPEAEEISSAPPDCRGKAVALVWPDAHSAAPRLAVGGISATEDCGDLVEYVWKGEMGALLEWLRSAETIVAPDLKSLLNAFALPELPQWASWTRHFDLGLASYLLGPEDGDYAWDRLAIRWREQLGCQERGPAALALSMAHALRGALEASGLARLYESLELPLIPVLANMERRGVAIDSAAFRSFLEDVDREVQKEADKVYELAGERFNIRSARKLGEILYQRLGLEPAQKTRGGQPSTSQMALEKLAPDSPLVDSILRFRRLEKMRSTYLDPLPRLMDAEGRIHTTFNQEATATGRLSSSNPNLQNIPVRGLLGKRMRACFIAAPGNCLLAADYSQIELRILAHFSGETHLLEAFRNGEDIHARTAAIIFEVAQDQINPDQRRMAKTINFGLLYGMGARKLAQELKISTAMAKDFIDRYFERLSGLQAFYDSVINGAVKNGYVTTMTGRRRWLLGISSDNGQTAAQARRQAVNTVIQGSAADVIKLAMIAVDRDAELDSLGARLLLQVHDELLLEAPEDVAEPACRRVAGLMEAVRPGGQSFAIPLAVDWGVGRNWGEAH